MDAPTLDHTKNYMVSYTDLDHEMSCGVIILDIVPRENLLAVSTHLEGALLDSATTYTILGNLLFYLFIGNNTKAWQVYQIHTIVGG